MLKINYLAGLSFKRQPRFFNFFLFFLIFSFAASAQSQTQEDGITRIIIEKDKLPVIDSLSPSRANTVLKDYNSIVENNSKLISAGREPEIMFFQYTNSERFTFQGVAARTCITQETLAQECGVTINVLKSWIFNNRLPDVAQAIYIAKTLNTSVEYLVRGIEKTEEHAKQTYGNHPPSSIID